jgi:hypothetical protein
MNRVSVTIREKRPGQWTVRVSAGGKRVERSCASRQDAEALAARIVKRQQGRDEAVAAGSLAVLDTLHAWQDEHGALRAPRTRKVDVQRIRHLEYFGQLDLRELTETHLRAFASAKLAEGLSGWTVAGCISILRGVYNLAESDGRFRSARRLPWARIMRESRKD